MWKHLKKWWPLLKNKTHPAQQPAIPKEHGILLYEIRLAHNEWMTAQHCFDFVVEKEQVDYAIFAMEAAEKRFEMLIRQAKNMNVNAWNIDTIMMEE